MKSSWGADLFRSLFAAIDSAIYGLISVVYEILINITKVDIFGEGAIETMGQKIYTILVVFMLFKVTFSFISYLVNPESLTDNAKGAQKVILNIILVLVMIMINPIAFQKLKEAQNAILTDQVIPRFIFGTDSVSLGNLSYKISDKCSNQSYAKKNGDYIALLVFRPFFQPDASVPPGYCGLGNAYTSTIYGSVPAYLSADIVNYTVDKVYAIDYKIGVTTIVGLVVLLIIVSFCFDIAVRAIKLGFLELIAPIPIISYVDPKSGKDGMFKKWLKEVGRTWADLFIRLAALFFAVFVIQLTQSDQMFAQVSEYKFWVVLFVIIGALMFAKKLPKLIEDILGIKLGGDLTLNPLKKIRENALGGKAIASVPGKAFGFGAGLVGGAIAGGAAGNQVGARLRGTLLGAVGGSKGGFKKPKGAFTTGMREEYKNLTGNEMARFSMGKIMLSKSGKKKVQETKDDLKVAYSNLNDKQTELNVSEHMTASLAESIRSHGIDISDADVALKNIRTQLAEQQSNLNPLREKMEEYQQAYAKAQDEYEAMEKRLKSGILGANGQPIYTEAQVAAAKNKAEQVKNEFTMYQRRFQDEEKTLGEYKQLESNLMRYKDNKTKESALRDEISAIQKNIDTMKSEKAQRERFYQVDKSPREDYKKAVQEERTRQNKK